MKNILIWFVIFGTVDFLFFLLRGLKVLSARMINRVLIAISCLLAGLILLPQSAPQTMIQITAGLIIVIATLAMVCDIFALIFYKLKSLFFRKKVVCPALALPDYLMEICKALGILAARRTGALIIIRQNDMLEGYIDKGIPFDAQVNAEALVALFSSDSPVHDGAVLVSTGRIRRVKSTLSLKTDTTLPMGVGTRHRAAVGITQKSDAIALIASEERGEISLAYRGQLVRVASQEQLCELIDKALKGKDIIPVQPELK